jgi:hypothetical protein
VTGAWCSWGPHDARSGDTRRSENMLYVIYARDLVAARDRGLAGRPRAVEEAGLRWFAALLLAAVRS